MCIFCMAALLMMGASLSAVALGNMESRLALTSTVSEVRRSVDTASTVIWYANVMVRVPNRPAKKIPVAIHLYKQHKRLRVQILTHDLSQAEAEAVQDVVCQALDARVISRHFPGEATLTERDPRNQTAQPQTIQQDSQERFRLK